MTAPAKILAMPPYPWLTESWGVLANLLAEEKLPHAILFSAEEGLGIDMLALAFAQYILCEQPQGRRVCEQCKACKLLAAGSHPDFKLIEPEDKSPQLKVDQIREVNQFVGKTAQQGAWKVVVLNPAENMNQNAANALLKNLEEPSSRTLFLLVSHHPAKVLATIRSRCRQITHARPSEEVALEWLHNNGVKDLKELIECLGLVPLKILDWANNNRLQEQQKIITAVESLLTKKATTSVISAEWLKQGPENVLKALIFWLEQEIRRFHLEKKPAHILSLLFRFGDRLRQKRSLLEGNSNVNAGLLVDEVILDISALARTKGIFD